MPIIELDSAKSFDRVVRPRAAAHLRKFRASVEESLGNRVTKVLLFGSRARGDARRGSDYDVAVFVKDLADRKKVDHELADLAYPHILDGFHIRPVAVPHGYLTSSASGMLATRIRQDGVPVP